MTSILTFSCMKKSSFNFFLLSFVGSRSGIRDKRRSDPDPGYQKMVGSGIRDKHPGSATLAVTETRFQVMYIKRDSCGSS
jgi:hypothetical protein